MVLTVVVSMLAVLMITAGYMGAVSVVTTVKWFWFLFGMAMFLPVIYSLARTFRETVITRKDPEMIELYGKIAWLTIIMWSFYPVVWLFSEGFASFSVSFEVTCVHEIHRDGTLTFITRWMQGTNPYEAHDKY
jgi:bacteriorhodopsin